MSSLADRHPHPRDERISFEPSTHTYTIRDVARRVRSVTTVIHSHFPRFDADLVLSKMKGKAEKYPGASDAQIKEMWSRQGKEASRLGTLLHAHVEKWYNHLDPLEDLKIDPEVQSEWAQVMQFHHDVVEKEGLQPYRTEWSVFDEDAAVAGQIDMVFRRSDGTFALYDWKRIKELKTDNPWEKGTGPCASLDHCNGVHYSLQLNLYRHLLQTRYGMSISEMNLVLFHPERVEFERVRIPVMDEKLVSKILKGK